MIPNTHLIVASFSFNAAREPRYTDYFALLAIRECMSINAPIPDEFKPYMEAAISARMKSNQKKVPERITEDKWEEAIWRIGYLMQKGYLRADAIEQVEAITPEASFKSLESRYKGTGYASTKDAVEIYCDGLREVDPYALIDSDDEEEGSQSDLF